MTHQKILKAAGKVGSLTTISRVLGYIRDASLAAVLGAGMNMDAFTIAYRIANLFRRLLGEGAMTAAFVPVFTEYKEDHDSKELWEFASKFFYTLGFVLLVLVILQIVFARIIVGVMSPGFMVDPPKWELTVFLSRLMASYIFFIGLAAVLMGVLNSVGSYAVSAANPILFNLFVILSTFTFAKWFDDPAIGVALGVLFGGFCQMAIQIPAAWQKGMRFKPSISFTHPGVKRISVLMGPGVLGIGVYQINLLVDSIISSFLPEGSVSSIYYSNRVVELVQGIFILSFATVMLTEMSTRAAKKDRKEMQSMLSFALRMVSFVTIPATLGLFILARPITQVLFQHGKFDTADTERTAFALAFYALGIFFVAGARILVQAFYAVQDTKTPVKCAVWSLLINAAGSFILMHPLKQGGIALATSIAAAFNFWQLFKSYEKSFGRIEREAMKEALIRVSVQSIAMGISCIVFLNLFNFSEKHTLAGESVALFGTILLAILVYLATAMALKSKELDFFKKPQHPPETLPTDVD